MNLRVFRIRQGRKAENGREKEKYGRETISVQGSFLRSVSSVTDGEGFWHAICKNIRIRRLFIKFLKEEITREAVCLQKASAM